MENMKVLGILQARASSSRLPGKILKSILGKPMLLQQIERIKRVPSIEQLIVATSTSASDDPLVDVLLKNNIKVFRGSLNDVLDRFYKASLENSAEHIVRLTGDCPLSDPEIIENVIQQHLNSKVDYTSNTFPETFPDGLDVEIFRFDCLKKTWEEAVLPSEREHVTPYIRNSIGKFTHSNIECSHDLSSMRWTVDEPEDFEFIEKVYEGLYSKNKAFNMSDVLAYLQVHPNLTKINTHIERNEGAKKSFEVDEIFLQEKKK